MTVPSRHLSVNTTDAEPSSPGLTEVRDLLPLGWRDGMLLSEHI